MKRPAVIVLSVALSASCADDVKRSPISPSITTIKTDEVVETEPGELAESEETAEANEPSGESSDSSSIEDLLAVEEATEAPQITIGGESIPAAGINKGLVAMDCGKAYNGQRVVNDKTGSYPWTISGRDFGSVKGTALLNGQEVKIISWQTTAIKIDPTMPWTSAPISTTLKIRTSAGLEVSQNVQVVPAISTRIYGQCTHFVALRRKQMGLQPSPTAYGDYKNVTAAYVPRRGDQYQWNWSGGKHTAIVTSVSGPTTVNGETTYSVTVDEQNANCANQLNTFVASFAVKGNAITTPLKHPKLGKTSLYYPGTASSPTPPAPTPPAPNPTLNDNFNSGRLDPARWQIEGPPRTGSAGSALLVNQRLELTKGSGTGGAGIVTTCFVTGDFDVQVDYQVLSWPRRNLHSLLLRALDLSISLSRNSSGNEFYLLSWAFSPTLANTADISGRLRLVRAGSTLAGHYSGPDGRWHQVGSVQASTARTRMSLEIGSSDVSALGGVRGAFDNFVANLATPTCSR